jgi:hypothetical protein
MAKEHFFLMIASIATLASVALWAFQKSVIRDQ